MLVRLWHAEQASEIKSLASPSGSCTAARSCICSCARPGRVQDRNTATTQIQNDRSDIAPPASGNNPYLRRRNASRRYKIFRAGCVLVGPLHRAARTVQSAARGSEHVWELKNSHVRVAPAFRRAV